MSEDSKYPVVISNRYKTKCSECKDWIQEGDGYAVLKAEGEKWAAFCDNCGKEYAQETPKSEEPEDNEDLPF